MRDVAPVSMPESWAMTRSTGPPGRELNHDERYQHDPEDRGDHEQNAADDIGGHDYVICRLVAIARPPGSGLRPAQCKLAAGIHVFQ